MQRLTGLHDPLFLHIPKNSKVVQVTPYDTGLQYLKQKSTQVSSYNNLPKSPNYPYLNFLTACNTYLNTYVALPEKKA